MSSRRPMSNPSWHAGWTGCCAARCKKAQDRVNHRASRALPAETPMTATRNTIAAAIAANRFGLGARPGELETVGSDPRGWLTRQLHGTPPVLAGAGLKPSSDTLARVLDLRKE